MGEYRVYAIDLSGRVIGPPRYINSASDKALEQAPRLFDGAATEVWDGARLVGHAPPTEKIKWISQSQKGITTR